MDGFSFFFLFFFFFSFNRRKKKYRKWYPSALMAYDLVLGFPNKDHSWISLHSTNTQVHSLTCTDPESVKELSFLTFIF